MSVDQDNRVIGIMIGEIRRMIRIQILKSLTEQGLSSEFPIIVE